MKKLIHKNILPSPEVEIQIHPSSINFMSNKFYNKKSDIIHKLFICFNFSLIRKKLLSITTN